MLEPLCQLLCTVLAFGLTLCITGGGFGPSSVLMSMSTPRGMGTPMGSSQMGMQGMPMGMQGMPMGMQGMPMGMQMAGPPGAVDPMAAAGTMLMKGNAPEVHAALQRAADAAFASVPM